ncbi:MAG: TonB-dependent receptor plug domain-containing protein, partial [Novosphingobium sp.]
MGERIKKVLLRGASLLSIVSVPASAQAVADSLDHGSARAPTVSDGVSAEVVTQDEGATVGDIVVTARRRSETLNNVPVVVSVLGPAQIANNNATDLAKIGELTPTVIVGAYKSAGGGSIAIRGISSPANQAGFEQAVSVAIDGVQTSDGRVAQLGIFD